MTRSDVYLSKLSYCSCSILTSNRVWRENNLLTLSDAFPQKECTNMQTLNIASDSDRPSALFSSLRDNKESLFELKGIQIFQQTINSAHSDRI